MRQQETELESSLPLELKIRVLEAELDRVESDFQMLRRRKQEIEAEILHFKKRLNQVRRRRVLRRVK